MQLHLDLPGAPTAPEPQWRRINVCGVRVERVRAFGREWTALSVWRRLELHRLLREAIPSGQEGVNWDLVACILATARICAQTSELSVAEHWYEQTALADILGVPAERINESRLYRGLEELLGCKDAICRHRQEQWGAWFGTGYDFLLYDVTSTYFEGEAKAIRRFSIWLAHPKGS